MYCIIKTVGMCLKYFQGKQTTVEVVIEDGEPGEGAETMGSQQTHHQRRDPHTTRETLAPLLTAFLHLVAPHSSHKLQGIQIK